MPGRILSCLGSISTSPGQGIKRHVACRHAFMDARMRACMSVRTPMSAYGLVCARTHTGMAMCIGACMICSCARSKCMPGATSRSFSVSIHRNSQHDPQNTVVTSAQSGDASVCQGLGPCRPSQTSCVCTLPLHLPSRCGYRKAPTSRLKSARASSPDRNASSH